MGGNMVNKMANMFKLKIDPKLVALFFCQVSILNDKAMIAILEKISETKGATKPRKYSRPRNGVFPKCATKFSEFSDKKNAFQ